MKVKIRDLLKNSEEVEQLLNCPPGTIDILTEGYFESRAALIARGVIRPDRLLCVIPEDYKPCLKMNDLGKAAAEYDRVYDDRIGPRPPREFADQYEDKEEVYA